MDWHQYRKLFLMFTITLLLFIGCSNRSIDTSDSSTGVLHTWVGDYTFYEYAPPNINMEYTISIYKEINDYYANITIDGFLTEIRAKAKVSGGEQSIDLIFEEYLENNLNEQYSKGDVLLSLKNADSEMYTYWDKIKPVLNENNESGKIYFAKEKEEN